MAVVIGAGFLVALVGGKFHIDLGGIVILMVMGGAGGLLLHAAYEKGKREGVAESRGPRAVGARTSNEASKEPGTRRRVWEFVAPWGEDTPATVAEAMARITEVYWSKDYPEMRFHDRGLTVTLRSRGVDDKRTLEITASEDTDVVTIRLRDDLGEIFAEGGPWRFPSNPNADQQQSFHFVESILMEDLVHAVTSAGEDLALSAKDIESRVAEDPGLRVRSWNGGLDRSPAEA